MLFSHDDKERMYSLLSRTRVVQDTLVGYWREKKASGPLLQGHWQEAMGAGCAIALEMLGIQESSWIGHSHRDQSIFVAKGLELELLRNHFLKETSWNSGRDGNIHLGSREHRMIPFISHMGASVPIAVGVANALRDDEWQEDDDSKRPVVIVFYGDGAAQQGDVHEALNKAAVDKSPVLFVVNDNRYAISTRPEDEHGGVDLAKRALGYANFEGFNIDGNDIEEVCFTAMHAIRRAQRGEGPSLIVCRSYRGSGHNDTENTDYMDEEEKERASRNEPLVFYRRQLLEEGFTKEDFDIIDEQNKVEIEAIAQEAYGDPDPVPDRSSVEVFAPTPPSRLPMASSLPSNVKTKKMSVREAINYTLEEILSEHPDASLFGEDVTDPKGGILGTTRGLSTKFPDRVKTTPISEAAIIGEAIGRALAGQRPIAEIQFSPFASDAFSQIIYVAAATYYHKGISLPLVIRMPRGIVGPGGSGHFHSHCNEAWYASSSGLKLVFPADAYDAKGLLQAAFEDPNPVLFFEDIRSYGRSLDFDRDVPLEPYLIPLGKAAVKREGSDVTVVAHGANAVAASLNTAEQIQETSGVSLEVIDLRTLIPLDKETVFASVEKTGRCIIMHEASLSYNPGAEIAALLAQERLWDLRAPVMRLAADDRPIDSHYDLEWERLPFEEDKGRLVSRELIEATRKVMEY